MVVGLLGTVATLEKQVAALTKEIVWLKDLKGRPPPKAIGMEQGTEAGRRRAHAEKIQTGDAGNVSGRLRDGGRLTD